MSASEWVGLGFSVAYGLIVVGISSVLPPPSLFRGVLSSGATVAALYGPKKDDGLKDLVDAERQRVTALAKGVATTAGGLLVALIPALLKKEITVPSGYIVLVVTSAAALLVMAARAAGEARSLGERLAYLYRLRGALNP